MDDSSPSHSTPKRKRCAFEDVLETDAPKFSLPTRPFLFEAPSPVTISRSSYASVNLTEKPSATFSRDGESPRTQFTEQFDGLTLNKGGDEFPSSQQSVDEDEAAALLERGKGVKRARVVPTETEVATGVTEDIAIDTELLGTLRSSNRSIRSILEGRVSKLRSPKKKSGGAAAEQPTIVDPIRAALTWQDDEITIYDPNDADDDGTGVNGIGFKPSAAIAHRRLAQRRKQLAEYRKREEQEARAHRRERRRGADAVAAASRKSSSRKVRFMEPGAPAVFTV